MQKKQIMIAYRNSTMGYLFDFYSKSMFTFILFLKLSSSQSSYFYRLILGFPSLTFITKVFITKVFILTLTVINHFPCYIIHYCRFTDRRNRL